MLLGAGAAVAARDHSRRSPLHYAGGSVAVTQLLLDFGADPEAQVIQLFRLRVQNIEPGNVLVVISLELESRPFLSMDSPSIE